MTELVRRAILQMREAEAVSPDTFECLLRETRGTWPQEDGLEYQQQLRDEWSTSVNK